MRGRTRVCETCQAYIQITYVVPFFTDTELARRTTEFERNNIVGTSVAARRMRSPPPPIGPCRAWAGRNGGLRKQGAR